MGILLLNSLRVDRNLGNGFTCADSVIGPFTNNAGTTTPLTAFDERAMVSHVLFFVLPTE